MTAEDENFVWNFAFGANMLESKLAARTGAKPLESIGAVVKDYELRFEVMGIPCVEPVFGALAKAEGHAVHGVLHRLTRAQFQTLRATEGGGGVTPGYDVIVVPVHTYDGRKVEAFAWTASPSTVVAGFLPSPRLINIMLTGARQHRLSPAYVAWLEEIPRNQSPLLARTLIMILTTLLVLPILIPLYVTVKAGLSAAWAHRYASTMRVGLWFVYRLIPGRSSGVPICPFVNMDVPILASLPTPAVSTAAPTNRRTSLSGKRPPLLPTMGPSEAGPSSFVPRSLPTVASVSSLPGARSDASDAAGVGGGVSSPASSTAATEASETEAKAVAGKASTEAPSDNGGEGDTEEPKRGPNERTPKKNNKQRNRNGR